MSKTKPAKRRTVGEYAAEAAREMAQGALSALESGAAGSLLLEAKPMALLRSVALSEYRRRFPAGGRATYPWLFYDGNPATKHIRGTPERVDVYCVFCREMLINGAVLQRDYTSDVVAHTDRCALLLVAGRLEPGAPGTYRLPAVVP